MVKSGQVLRHAEEIARQGYTVVPNVASPERRRAIIAALEGVEANKQIGFGASEFEGRNTVRIYNLLAEGAAFWPIPVDEMVLPIAEAVLDEELLLSSLSAITLAPGQAAQPIHEDTQQIPYPRPRPPLALNAIWALTDFTEANGATRIVPGSHLYDAPPAFGASYETIAAEMPAGSVLVYDSQLWHGGGANRTNERRWALACYYCVGWMRQQENQQLGIPKEVARAFPRRLQELCGYSVYKGQYGHIANGDPIELLGRERVGKMVWDDSQRDRLTGGK